MQICENSELGNPGCTCSDLPYKIGKDLTFQGHSFSTLEYDIENNSFDDFNIGLKQSFSNVSAESRGDFFIMGIAGPHPQSFSPVGLGGAQEFTFLTHAQVTLLH